jgi:A/G-specific adenine glycosylase
MNNKRDLPWRNTTDPYHIWVSEVIMQQTRVAQGLAYYERFIETFPTIASLARAPQEKVLKLWQGLGYYSRARNMHAAAKQVVEQYDGLFPRRYSDLLTLKGVGEYTAAAIASFAYNTPVAVVDGNVIRVISRLFAVQNPVDKPSGLNEIKKLAADLLHTDEPALHNQAIMEFGALHCTPSNPDCIHCPLSENCLAYRYKIVDRVPFKSSKVKVRDRHFYYLVIKSKEGVYFQQRVSGDIWEGLFEFPLIEATGMLSPQSIQELVCEKLSFTSEFKIVNISSQIKHILTHQRLLVSFIVIEINDLKEKHPAGWITIALDDIHQLAVPRVIDKYLQSSNFNKII